MGDNRQPLDPEGKIYDPEGYENVQNTRTIINIASGVGFFIFLLVFIGSVSSDDGPGAGLVALFFILMAGGLVCHFADKEAMEQHLTAVAEAKAQQNDEVQAAAEGAHVAAEAVHDRIEELEKTMAEISNAAIKTGDIIINGENAAVVVGSGSIEIINGKKENNPELAAALSVVLGHIENSKNEAAAEVFDRFTKEINKPEPDKVVTKSLWDSIIAISPAIKELAGVTAAIAKLFV